FGGRSKLSTWMIRVAINVCLTDHRRAKLRRTLSLEAEHGPTGSGFSGSLSVGEEREPGSPARVQHAEERELLYAAMTRLDEQHRAIIILRDVQDMDYHQIARVLGVAEGTVKSRLFRARQGLREWIERLTVERTRKDARRC
ncbi:MAG TPA: RNA polymerase sigma factor, partial [Phycisphaerales bacterium]|nr:RNA polymerase sigma factor [Phycisphaerales bacterium]